MSCQKEMVSFDSSLSRGVLSHPTINDSKDYHLSSPFTPTSPSVGLLGSLNPKFLKSSLAIRLLYGHKRGLVGLQY